MTKWRNLRKNAQKLGESYRLKENDLKKIYIYYLI